MIILEINVEHFGKLKDKRIPLRPGMNVITGDNESGKSTIAGFIKAMFFGLTKEEFGRFFPRKEDGIFAGSLKVLQNGANYRIRRDFLADDDSLRVEKIDGDIIRIPDPERWLSEALSGMTKQMFLETSFTSQMAFLKDEELWEKTDEKTEQAEKNRNIREQAKAAGKVLTQKKRDFEKQINPTVDENVAFVTDSIKAQEESLSGLEAVFPEQERELNELSEALATEGEAVERANQERKDQLKSAMLDKKNALAEYTNRAERLIDRGNGFGIALMVIGILGAVASYFFYSSEKITPQHDLFLWAIIAFAASGLFFIAGIILTAVYSAKRKKAKEALSTRCDLHDNAEEAERAYQYYLNHPDEDRIVVPNQADKERRIAECQDTVDKSKQLMEETEKSLEALREKKVALDAEAVHQRELLANISALEKAITQMQVLSEDANEELYAMLSEKANEYLEVLKVEAPIYIHLQDDMLYVDYEGKPVQTAMLSTSTLQSVFLAIRMALFDKYDPNKNVIAILDDAFTNMDMSRMRTAMGLVRASGRQILLLTCQPREKDNVNN